ncbi:MAG: YdcF family protein [Clostridia bacterium]|nr:YdcF family protein [Clostridia bacterium]
MKKEKTVRSGWKRLLRVLAVLIGLGILAFALLVGMLCIQEGRVPGDMTEVHEDYDAVIVLGAQVKPDGELSVQLTWRLDAALQAWQRKNVPVVVCGAQGETEPETEASAMKKYLVAQGIPEERILTDPDSFNTRENLVNAKALLEKAPEEIRKVLVVTSDYHMPRSLALARDLGLEAAGLGSPCLPEFWLKNHGREALAWCKYFMNKYLHLGL